MPEPESRLQSSMSTAEWAGKGLLLLGAIIYGVGLLVVNMYLRQFGFSDYSVLRARFILTGIVALMPIGVILLLFIGVETLIRRDVHRVYENVLKRAAHFAWSVFMIFAIVLFCGLIWTLFLHYTGIPDDIEKSVTTQIISIALTVVLTLRLSARGTLPQIASGRFAETFHFDLVFSILFLALFALTFIVYLSNFSVTLFPAISEQFGGAAPKVVQLVINSSSAEEGADAGLLFEKDSLRSVPMPLLWEGEYRYLLSYPQEFERGWTVQVNKEIVAAAIVFTGPELDNLSRPSLWRGSERSFATPHAND